MEKTYMYVISRHDEMDNCHSPYYFTDSEEEAKKIVKHLNETDGLNVTLEEDGSVADIKDDDAIWYDYCDVCQYQPEK
ncbi:hypothetical protein IKN40_08865 [bacterium]|nr:hypothetical protein [Clostridia bacterium]MBR4617966.1 hypothetical protein [Bacilli bacterium]MBR6908530.1 hypothetical protein [bacterium]